MNKLKKHISIFLVLLTFSFLVECDAKTANTKQKKNNISNINRDISLSTDLMSDECNINFEIETHKQLEGYHLEVKFKKGYSEEDFEYSVDQIVNYIIADSKGKKIHKSGKREIELISKYGDEIFFNEGGYYTYYKAINVKTGAIREFLPRNSRTCNSPIIYKNKIYYINGECVMDRKKDETPWRHISTYDMQGNFIEHIPLQNFTKKKKFLGIAYDKIYYTSNIRVKGSGGLIERCNLDGSGYEVVSKKIKLNHLNKFEKENIDLYSKGYGFDYNMGSISYDDTGWYFIGGKKKPFNNICKLDFKSGKIKIIKKKVRYCSVLGNYIYYTESKDSSIYRMNIKTKKTKVFLKCHASNVTASGNDLYYLNVKPKKWTWYKVNLTTKKVSKIPRIR